MSAASSRWMRSRCAARLSGYLSEIHFTDGQMVKKGDLLFTIDRRPFQIALEQMRANLAQARANLAFTEADLARGQELRAQQDHHRAELRPAHTGQARGGGLGRGAGGDGALGRARLQRIFAAAGADRRPHRRSPRVRRQSGDRRHRQQYHVAGDHRVGRSDPLRVHLRRSLVSALPALCRAGQQDGASGDSGVAVSLKLIDEQEFEHTGKMDFVDNVIDRSSGTIRGRAVFDNPGGQVHARHVRPHPRSRLAAAYGAAHSRRRHRYRAVAQVRARGR